MHNRFRKLEDRFIGLGLFSIILAITLQVYARNFQALATASIIWLVVSFLLIVPIRLIELERKSDVRLYYNWSEVPKKHKIPRILNHMTAHGTELEVIGRTCFRWLCGDELDFDNDHAKFRKDQKERQDQIRQAIEHGSSIHFILQNPNIQIPMPLFTEDENETLDSHARAAIKSYDAILAKLAVNDTHRFRLSFLDEVVENSMTREREKNNLAFTKFVFDIGIEFQAPGGSENDISKPFLLFTSSRPGHERFLKRFELLLASAVSREAYLDRKIESENEIESLIKEYSLGPIVRRNNSEALATTAAKNFMTLRTPPVSIQLLLTNDCTTRCKMCDHFGLFEEGGELSTEEVRCTLECIADLGTDSLIISGGEPLAREDIFDVLEHAHDLGLHTGLLTNGVMRGGVSLSLDDAKKISRYCSWVQLSIDSLNKKTYEEIRRHDLDTVITSLNNLVKAGIKNVEVSFAIQKDNIWELADIPKISEQILPSTVPIRFKFAHGPGNQEIFCEEKELTRIMRALPINDRRFNFGYLCAMIDSGHFSKKDIADGVPLRTTMERYGSLKFKCHALRLTCTINANGDVYPCCFLFSDNCADSLLRRKYLLGTLRHGVRVMPPAGGQNHLADIWFDNSILKGLLERTLPVDNHACHYCTRHFYQNEYFNKLYACFEAHKHSGVDEYVLRRKNQSEPLEPFWV